MAGEAQAAEPDPKQGWLRRKWSEANQKVGVQGRRLSHARTVLREQHGRQWDWARQGLQAGEVLLMLKGHHEAAYSVRGLMWLGDALFRPSK